MSTPYFFDNKLSLIETAELNKEEYTTYTNRWGNPQWDRYPTHKLEMVPDKQFNSIGYTRAFPFYTTKIFKYSPINFRTHHQTVDYVYEKAAIGEKPTLVSKIHTGEVIIEYYTPFNPFL